MHVLRGPRCYWVELHHFDASVLAVYKDLGFKTFLILRHPIDHFVSDFNYHFRMRRPMYPAPGSWTEAGYGATSNMTKSEPARRYWEGRFDEAISDVASPGMQMRCERSRFQHCFFLVQRLGCFAAQLAEREGFQWVSWSVYGLGFQWVGQVMEGFSGLVRVWRSPNAQRL
jgi:hypothetical protein